MPTQSLPAASLRTADRLPAARVLVQVSIYLIYKVLWPMRKASSGAESSFLPALREVWGGGSRSAGQALGAGGDLRGVNLCDADLSGARLEGCEFLQSGTRWRRARRGVSGWSPISELCPAHHCSKLAIGLPG